MPAGAGPSEPSSSHSIVMDCSNAAIARSNIDKLEQLVRYQRGVIDRLRSEKKSIAAAAAGTRRRDKPALVGYPQPRGHLCSRQLSRHTVTRWEVAAGTSIIASMALFHKEHERAMRDQRPGWCISITECVEKWENCSVPGSGSPTCTTGMLCPKSAGRMFR